MDKKILAIIPAFNEEHNIENVVKDVRQKLPFIDILVINDCSTDKTLEVCYKNNIKVISTIYNLGIGGAVQTGFKYAVKNDYDIAVQIDSDGQHNPQEANKLIEAIINNQCEVCIGSRYLNKFGYSANIFRRIGILLFSTLTSIIIAQKITDVTSGFRAYSRKALEFCASEYPADFPDSEAIIILKLTGFRLIEIPIVMKKRASGVSSTGFLRSLYYPFKNIISIFAGILRKK